jgi:cytochrome c553
MNRAAIGICAIVLLSACGQEPEPTQAVVDAAAGGALVNKECSGCHAEDGSGKSPDIPNLGGQPVSYLVDAMHAYRDGRRHHAALQDLISGLSEVQIQNIAAWYASLPPVPPATEPEPDLSYYTEGREVADTCTDCHGDRGISNTAGVPSLAGQQPAYLIVSTQEYTTGERGHAEIEGMLKGLDQVDIEKMAFYFAAQVPLGREAPGFGDPAAGEPLTAQCGGCHGAHGISHDPLVPTLAGQEPYYLLASMKAYRDHERKHKGMITNQSDADLENMAAYYAVQTPSPATEADDSVETLAAKCDRCHGPVVGNSKLVVPSLNGQKRDYLLRVMQEYRDGNRGSSMMHKMSAGYDDETLEALADWYASRPPQ